MSQDAFLQAIFEQPQDDELRLVYADWLEEHGGESGAARARYLRLALEKSRLHRRSQRRYELQRQMNELLKEHRGDWFPDSPLARGSSRGRGFIWHARGSAEAFERHAAPLFAREPITYLYVERGGNADVFRRFAANPLLRRLRHIRFADQALPADGLATLVKAGNLSNLENLELSHWVYNRDEFSVLARSNWPKLRRLFTLRCGLDDIALKNLVQVSAPNLVDLHLCTENFGAEGLSHLQAAPWLGQLTALHLTQMQGSFSNDALGELLEDPRLGKLRRLDVSHNLLGPDGIARLARVPHFANLENLDLGYINAGAEGLLEIFNSPNLAKLRYLSFSANDVSFAGAPPRPAAKSWPALRSFYLGNKITDADFIWMLEHGLFTGPCRLFLSMGLLTSASLVILLRSPVCRRLHTLWLGMNPLGPPEDVPATIMLPRLRELDLNSSELTDAGAARLIRAIRAPRLRDLNLYKNELGNESVRAIAANPSFRNLEELSLSYHSNIDDEGAKALLESKYLNRLRELQVFESGISDAGIEMLRKRFRRVCHR